MIIMANGGDITQTDPSRPKQLNQTVAGISAGNCDSTSGGMGSRASAAEPHVPGQPAIYPQLQAIPGEGGYLLRENFLNHVSFDLTADAPDIPHSYCNGAEGPDVSDSPRGRLDDEWWLYRMQPDQIQQMQLRREQQATGYTSTGSQTAASLDPAADIRAAAPRRNGIGATTELRAATPSSLPSYDSMGAMSGSLIVAGASGGDAGEDDDFYDDDDEYDDDDNDDDGHGNDLLRDIHEEFGHGHYVDDDGPTA